MLDAARIKQLALMARATLERFAEGATADPAEHAGRWLKPRDTDYELAFGKLGPRLREAYTPFWNSQKPSPQPGPGQTRMEMWLATTEDLQLRNERGQAFPGGYAKVADKLQPRLLWVRWKWVVPGDGAGTAYDGLVWLDDHWAWFPKPWRAAGI